MAVESTGYPHTNTLRHEHAGGDGELGCLCGKAGTSHVCDDSTHSSGCVVNGYGCLMATKACKVSQNVLPQQMLLQLTKTTNYIFPCIHRTYHTNKHTHLHTLDNQEKFHVSLPWQAIWSLFSHAPQEHTTSG